MAERYITDELIQIIAKENTKIAYRVSVLIERDFFSVVARGNVFWLQSWGGSTIPNYAHDWVKSKLRKKGYIYLYDLSNKVG